MSGDRQTARDELVRQLVESGLPEAEAAATADALLGQPLAAGQTISGLTPDHLAELVRRAFAEQRLESAKLEIRRTAGDRLELSVVAAREGRR